MSNVIKIKRGLDIKLKQNDFNESVQPVGVTRYAVKPTDFHGLVPRLLVREGDAVRAGDALFADKACPEVRIVSPVSGTVEAVVRGDKRKLLEIVVAEDTAAGQVSVEKLAPAAASREQVSAWMLKYGFWPMLRQRPYAIVANPQDTPKAVFVSGFDSAPLAPAYEKILAGRADDLQAGLDALARLTDGKVHLSEHANQGENTVFHTLKGVELHTFSGPHPAGSIGVQIHHVDAVNKGETVWYMNPQDVAAMGRTMRTGAFDASRVVAVTGSEVTTPGYVAVKYGACLSFLTSCLAGDHVRVVSGNVLTGEKVAADGFLGFYDHQVTVIPEGDYYEFMGWLAPGFGKFSFSRLFPACLCRKHAYRMDTNMHGAHRAFVMTGQYEKVVPMDIYPVQLLKAILAEDIERMEQLGIYEVAEEDFALCEVICTSKMDVQSILRRGIDLMIKEMN